MLGQPPTDKMVRVLLAIKRFAEEHGCWPGLTDVAKLVGLTKPGVHHRINSLVRRGLVIRDQSRKCHNITLRGWKLVLQPTEPVPILAPYIPRLGD